MTLRALRLDLKDTQTKIENTKELIESTSKHNTERLDLLGEIYKNLCDYATLIKQNIREIENNQRMIVKECTVASYTTYSIYFDNGKEEIHIDDCYSNKEEALAFCQVFNSNIEKIEEVLVGR